METYRKSLNSVFLFRMRTTTLMTALCVFMLAAGAANAVTYTDSSPQTIPGQNFIFTFSPVNPWSGGNGTFTVHARGDYSVEHPIECLNWGIDGLVFDVGAPAYGTVINEFSHDDVEWEQSYTINGGLMDAITSDSVINISVDLPSNINIISGSSFVEVEMTYNASGPQGPLPPAPDYPDPCDGAVEVPVDTCLAWNTAGCSVPCDLLNGGFESQSFAPWTAVTGPGDELTPWSVTSGGIGWFYNGFPLEGSFFAQNGFDGDAGLFYDIYQEVAIPACARAAVLNWSERIQWDMVLYGATLPRYYEVSVQPAGGGTPLAVLYARELLPGTQGDTGYVPHSIDLLSMAPGIAGQTVRINFHEYIPETYTGPAQFDLDGISLNCGNGAAPSISGNSLLAQQAVTPNFVDYNDLREAALASQNAPTDVRIGAESPSMKEEAAPEIISTVVGVMNQGGPDCGGYTFIDSDEPGGFSFDWIEISGSGTNLNLTDDSYYYPINLPFSFDFYGTNYNQLTVGSNGHIYFESQYLGYNNACIPGTNNYGVHRFIALYWDDLVPGGSENVYYRIIGSAPNRILVVQWENVRHFGSSSSRVTAQAQLFESSSDILLLYADPSSEAGSGATVGIQSDTACGLQYLCNQRSLHSGLAILFSRHHLSPTTWDVYLGIDDPCNMVLVCNDLNEPNCCPPGGLETGETYFWQVIAKNSRGETPGNVWSFETEGGDPPDCNSAVPSIAEIWPPRHEWVDIEILDVNDPDGDPVSITITGITQDEPVAGPGSGRTSPDGMGVGTSVAHVRAERSGRGSNGRVYEISFEADDGTGNTCNGSVKVCVPHDQGRGQGLECVDDGQLYDSTAAGMFSADLNGDGIINQLDFSILTDYWLVSYELED
ncbi:MAG: hypothetical protein ACYSR8_04595 [Planctomycetota bacterium]